GYWTGQTLGETIDHWVETTPDNVAILSEVGQATYGELGRYAKRIALGLLELGLKKNDMVIVQLPNWPVYLYVYYALMKTGIIGVMTLPHFRAGEVGHMVDQYNAQALIIPDSYHRFDYTEMAKGLQKDMPGLKHILVFGDNVPPGMLSLQQMMDAPLEDRYPPDYLDRFKPQGTDVAEILLTGGTTGFPKGIPRTHNDYVLTAKRHAEIMNFDADTVAMCGLPIALNATLLRAVGGLMFGGRAALTTSTSAEAIARAVQDMGATHILMAPTNVVDLLNFPDLDKYDMSALKHVMCGVGYLAPELLHSLRERLPSSTKITRGYGMAEGPIIVMRMDEPFEMGTRVLGKPCCEADEYRIVDPEGNDMGGGEEGELVTRGPHIFRGYFKQPDENEKAFDKDGYFHTGDIAVRDAEGNYMITGRIKEWIRRGGLTIIPVELEEILIKHPQVEKVAIVGMPDPRLGERTCAFIKPAQGQTITLDDVVKILTDAGLATFKMPERLELLDEMPVTQHDKVDKKLLRQEITDKLKAEGVL
ncbi:MAG: AMP-binding protein, partial [Dehalococcoidia bacterium]